MASFASVRHHGWRTQATWTKMFLELDWLESYSAIAKFSLASFKMCIQFSMLKAEASAAQTYPRVSPVSPSSVSPIPVCTAIRVF